MEWFLLLAVVVGVLAFGVLIVVGHFVWVIIARIFGFRVKAVRVNAIEPEAQRELAIIARRIGQFAEWGLIDADTFQHVMTAVRAEQHRLATGISRAPEARLRSVPPPLPVLPWFPDSQTQTASPDSHADVERSNGPDAVHVGSGSRTFVPMSKNTIRSAGPARSDTPNDARPPGEENDLVFMPAEESVPPRLEQTEEVTAEDVTPDRPGYPPTFIPPILPTHPPRRRRTFSQMLESFMEENNIRWGELVGGLLIVGCSIALVVSFWAGITQRPWLEFSVFTAVTAGFFALGLYTEHSWRLPTTSRGVLLIATLLAPLNFLAFAAFTRGAWPGVLTIGPEIVAFALFAYLLWQAGKVIAPIWPGLLTAGVCAASACLLLLGCIDVGPVSGSKFDLLGFIPLTAYFVLVATMLVRARRLKSLHAHIAHAILLLLGVLTFCTVLALGLLVHRGGDTAAGLRHLALPLSLGGFPLLATGLFLWRRLSGARLAMLRTAGAAVGVIGATVLLAGIAIAWPDPAAMLTLALCDFVALTGIALFFDLPAANWLAVPCAILAWALGFHLLRGDVGRASHASDIVHALCDPQSGTALAPLVLVLAGARALLIRFRRPADAMVYGAMAIATGAVSVALVSWAGFARSPDIYSCTAVYSVYAVASFAIAWRERRAAISWTGWLLLAAALIQLFVAHQLTTSPWPDALLTFAGLATFAHWMSLRIVSRRERASSEGPDHPRESGASLSARTRREPRRIQSADLSCTHSKLTAPARWLAVAAAILGIALALGSLADLSAGRVAIDVGSAGLILLVIATLEAVTPLFIAGQIVLTGAIGLLVFSRLALQKWFIHSATLLLEPWTLQIEAITLAVVCLGWKLFRIFANAHFSASHSDAPSHSVTPVAPRSFAQRFMMMLPNSAPFDRALGGGLLVLLIALVLFTLFPAISVEFSVGSSRLLEIDLRTIGIGSWALLALLVIVFAVDLWETSVALPLVALVAAMWLVCPLIAARGASLGESASALRWMCGGYLLVGFIPVWLRDRLRFPGFKASQRAGRPAELSSVARLTLLALGAGPIMLLTTSGTLMALGSETMPALFPGSFFGRIGPAWSHVIPLVIVALVLVVEAIRERTPIYAMAASGVLCLGGTLGYLLEISTAGRSFTGGDAVRLIQINALVMAGFACAWLAARHGLAMLRRDVGKVPPQLQAQVKIALVLNGLVIMPAAAYLALTPAWAKTFVAPAGGVWGWAAILLASTAAIASGMAEKERLTVRTLALATLSLAAMLGLTAVILPPLGGWDGYHVMLAADGLAAWGLIGLGAWIVRRGQVGSLLGISGSNEPPPQGSDGAVLDYQRAVNDAVHLPVYFGGQLAQPAFTRWTCAAGAIVATLAVRALAGDPGAPWWSMGAALALAFLAIALACWNQRRGFLYPAAFLLNFAAATWFLYRGWSAAWSGLDFLSVQIIIAALPGIAWLVLELHVFRRKSLIVPRGLPALHDVVAIGSTLLAVLEIASIVAARFSGSSAAHNPLLVGLALLCCASLLAACAWGFRARYALPLLYCLGLASMLFALNQSGISIHWLPWAMVTAMAGYALVTSAAFPQLARLSALTEPVQSPTYPNSTATRLPYANSAIAIITFAAATLADFSLEPVAARMMLASAALSQALSLAFLARDVGATQLRTAALLLLTAGLILWGWAPLPLEQTGILDRSFIALLITSAAAYLNHLMLRRRLGIQNPWRQAGSIAGRPLLGAAIGFLVAMLVAETLNRAASHVLPTHVIATGVLLTILGFCAMALKAAIRPGELSMLTDRQRSHCVYAAEALLAVAFFHLRWMEPQLFGGFLRPYWPLLVMMIAFVGVAAAEMLRRQGTPSILSEPVERTGIFLPILPVIGWWLTPAVAVNFGVLLLIVGAFYAVIAGLRKSFTFGVLAALSGNGALWNTLAHSDSLAFTAHPQLWLIPMALSVLAGAQLNRERLAPAQLRTIRYICLIAIYVSSTADIFLNGVERAPWLPLVLAGLSVAGVLLGVFFRIRPFLFLGAGFLLLSVITMIYFAAAQFHWTWIWYVAGICLGSAILALFALFEKKKEGMLLALEGLRQWE